MTTIIEDTHAIIPLDAIEQQTLERHEAVIAKGLATYIEVGRALLDIRDQRLYRATHQTYADYCNERWNMSRQRAYQLIDAAQVASDLSTIVDTSTMPESHLRAVAKAAPADRPAVLTRANELANGSPRTAKHIEQAVDQTKPPDVPPPDLSAYGYTARHLLDGRIAIRSAGNLESQHTHGQLNDLLAFWRSYPPIPADLAAAGVVWRYRSDRMYQVFCGDVIGHTGYTADECLASQRDAMGRAGLLDPVPTPLGDDEADQAALAGSIRELAEPLGLKMIWEDGKVLLYWPDEADQIERMDLLSYGAALEWLQWEAKGIKLDRDEAAAQAAALPPAVELPDPARLPAVPVRPKRPISADASAVIKYLKDLEVYASALESVIQALQKRLPE